MKSVPKEFLTAPTVYAVKNTYQNMVPVAEPLVMWAEVGGRCFYDDSNGVLRSACSTHRVTVPTEVLDAAGEYTLCFRTVFERKPYGSKGSEIMSYTSPFRPITSSPINIYHIADAHNDVDGPVAAGERFRETLDLLILNGDLPNHSGQIEYFSTIHQIAARLTNGEIPVVFSRGNHDIRGAFAELLADHTPTDNGRSYYTFRLGSLWGLVLDCGEDKEDSHPEYGNMNCCADFRRRQTEFLHDVIAHASEEYAAEGVNNRIVISHIPFTQVDEPPFEIEQETYAEWARLLREQIKPQIILCGHMHKTYISQVGSETDNLGQPCPVIVASERATKESPFVGCAVTITETGCDVIFNNGLDPLPMPEHIDFA